MEAAVAQEKGTVPSWSLQRADRVPEGAELLHTIVPGRAWLRKAQVQHRSPCRRC